MATDLSSAGTRFVQIATGHVCDALEHIGVITPAFPDRIRPMTTTARFAGPAVTLKLARNRTGREPRKLNEVIEEAVHPGAVLVVDGQGVTDAALFGDRAALATQVLGGVGAVINGGVRDIAGMEALEFPVHAAGRNVRASEGVFQGVGINVEVIIDGILIEAGDWLVGDESGICVVPAGDVERVLSLAEEREAIDREGVDGLRSGKTMREVHRHFKDDDVEALRQLE